MDLFPQNVSKTPENLKKCLCHSEWWRTLRDSEVEEVKLMDRPQIDCPWGYPGDIVGIHPDHWNPGAMQTCITHSGMLGIETVYSLGKCGK